MRGAKRWLKAHSLFSLSLIDLLDYSKNSYPFEIIRDALILLSFFIGESWNKHNILKLLDPYKGKGSSRVKTLIQSFCSSSPSSDGNPDERIEKKTLIPRSRSLAA